MDFETQSHGNKMTKSRSSAVSRRCDTPHNGHCYTEFNFKIDVRIVRISFGKKKKLKKPIYRIRCVKIQYIIIHHRFGYTYVTCSFLKYLSNVPIFLSIAKFL
jgi:hypothetical protein